MFQPKMIKDYEAASVTVEIEDNGRVAVLSFLTTGPDHLFVSIPLSALEHLVMQSAEALSVAPIPSRR